MIISTRGRLVKPLLRSSRWVVGAFKLNRLLLEMIRLLTYPRSLPPPLENLNIRRTTKTLSDVIVQMALRKWAAQSEE